MLGKNRFKKISKNMNNLPIYLIERMYYELLRMIMADLREKGLCMLPNWGSFYLKSYERRIGWNPCDGKATEVEPRCYVKFKPHEKLKHYFKNLVDPPIRSYSVRKRMRLADDKKDALKVLTMLTDYEKKKKRLRSKEHKAETDKLDKIIAEKVKNDSKM